MFQKTLLSRLSIAALGLLATQAFAQVDSVTSYGNRGASGVNINISQPVAAPPVGATPALTGPGGVPPGYEEAAVSLPGPAMTISTTTAGVLAGLGIPQIRKYNPNVYFTGFADICQGDYSGYVAYDYTSCDDGNGGILPSCNANTISGYWWCGAAGTATYMRKIVTDGRVPTELTPAQIQAQSTAMGTLGIVDNIATMNQVCVQSGYTRMYSYSKYEYDSSGVFSSCGKRLSSHFTTAWYTADSCSAVARLVCY